MSEQLSDGVSTYVTSDVSDVPLAAHWGYRTGAWLFTVGTIGAVVCLLALAVGVGQNDEATSLIGLGAIVAWVAAGPGFMLISPGQTLGMKIAGVRLDRRDGTPSGFWFAVFRFYVCGLIYVLPFVAILDWLAPLGARRLSLRDRIAKTRVVQQPEYSQRAVPLTFATLLAVGVYFAAAIGADKVSTQQDKEEFMAECTREDILTYGECECLHKELNASLTASESRAIERGDEPSEEVDEKFDAAHEACETL